MNRLSAIALELSAVGKTKNEYSLRLSNQRDDLAARQLALIPADGWPGKNAEERKINKQRAYAADETCQKIQGVIKDAEQELAGTEHAIQTLVDERRALEWQIRSRLEDTAFDDYADDVADARLEEKFYPDETPDYDPVADLEDIPY